MEKKTKKNSNFFKNKETAKLSVDKCRTEAYDKRVKKSRCSRFDRISSDNGKPGENRRRKAKGPPPWKQGWQPATERRSAV